MSDPKTKPDIVIIDDEVQIRRLLRFALEDAGYSVREADTGHKGLVECMQTPPDAVILDLGLPDIQGLDVLKRLREWSGVPVLILSVFGQENNKVLALDAGADDYLTKPFGGAELLARLRALLRRIKQPEDITTVSFGQVEIDLPQRKVTRAGTLVKLSAKEYDLLRLLVAHRDKVLTHGMILKEVWGPEAVDKTHYLRVYMMRLRRKLEASPDEPRHLLTESSIGYRLVSEA